MWCPKCKTEYRDGIFECAECGTPLVQSLPVEIDSSAAEEKIKLLKRIDSQQNMRTLSDGGKAYIEKSVKYEDMKSTAYSFLLVGGAGLILLILVFTGVIHVQFAVYMKSIMGIVMGGMFFIFLMIGIRSYVQLKDLKTQTETERQEMELAKNWFYENFHAGSIDTAAGVSASDELQQKYFLRSQYMKLQLSEQFPAYDDAFADYLTEQFYEELYPQD